MKPQLCAGLLACLALPLAWAGDAADLNFLGFAPDGNYLAFEQYGTHDGSGAPYSEFYFVETAKNEYSAKPVKPETPGEAAELETARAAARKTAADELAQAKIQTGNVGKHVIAHPLSDLGADASQAVFTTAVPLGGLAYPKYEIRLQETATDTDCAGVGKAKIFSLTLHGADGKLLKTLQKDSKLPAARGCPLRYRIQDVFVYNDKHIAVFLNVFHPGFEGENMRFMVVSGEVLLVGQ
jgi:predicted secreted protein